MQGLREVAELNLERAHQLAELIDTVPGFKVGTGAAFFNEFIVSCPVPATEVIEKMAARGIGAGYNLGTTCASMENCLLVCATELCTEADLQAYADALRGI